MIVTNGTLLDKQTVEDLRDAGILFGVSLDGDKKDNDYYRKDELGNGVYKKVIKNIKNIKDRSLMGVAVTLTDKNINLVKTMKHLIKYFPTISMKPVRRVDGRGGVDETNIEEVKHEYTRLYEFLLSETKKGNLEYIAALLNGDDYFGKFILRAVMGQKVSTRCDAGIGRFSLASDGNIYVCPGAVDIEELLIGTLDGGINYEARDKFWKHLTNRSKCNSCFARFVCGGECMINSYYSKGRFDQLDEVMCDLKKHIYKLSLLFKQMIESTHFKGQIYKACVEKSMRFMEDLEIKDILKKNPELRFLDVKNEKDILNRKE